MNELYKNNESSPRLWSFTLHSQIFPLAQESRQIRSRAMYRLSSHLETPQKKPRYVFRTSHTKHVLRLLQARAAQYFASQRDPYRVPANPPMAMQGPTPDIAALLQIINNQQQPQPQIQLPQPQPVAQAPTSGLEAIFAQFSAHNQQPQPMQAAQPSQPSQPSQPPAGFDFQSTLAAMSLAGQARPIYGQTPAIQPNLQSLLSQLSQQPSAQTQNYSYGNNYQAENERKRQMDYEDQGSSEYGNKGKRHKPEVKRKVGSDQYLLYLE